MFSISRCQNYLRSRFQKTQFDRITVGHISGRQRLISSVYQKVTDFSASCVHSHLCFPLGAPSTEETVRKTNDQPKSTGTVCSLSPRCHLLRGVIFSASLCSQALGSSRLYWSTYICCLYLLALSSRTCVAWISCSTPSPFWISRFFKEQSWPYWCKDCTATHHHIYFIAPGQAQVRWGRRTLGGLPVTPTLDSASSPLLSASGARRRLMTTKERVETSPGSSLLVTTTTFYIGEVALGHSSPLGPGYRQNKTLLLLYCEEDGTTGSWSRLLTYVSNYGSTEWRQHCPDTCLTWWRP